MYSITWCLGTNFSSFSSAKVFFPHSTMTTTTSFSTLCTRTHSVQVFFDIVMLLEEKNEESRFLTAGHDPEAIPAYPTSSDTNNQLFFVSKTPRPMVRTTPTRIQVLAASVSHQIVVR